MHHDDELRVAVVLTRFEPGGTERQMIELIRRLAPRVPVFVVCFDRAGAWLPRVVDSGAPIVEFPIRGFARPRTWWQVRAFSRWCRENRISVVQACDFYANVFALPGAALAGVPVRIGSRRELAPDKTAAQLLLQRQAYRCATKVVANSPAARRTLLREGLRDQDTVIIANGVDAGECPVRHARRPRTIITVANLRAEKRHDVLLHAAFGLVQRVPDLRFQVVGDGPRRAHLERLVASLRLTRSVEFLGHRDDVPALLANADIFVLPSRSEALPNGVIEAMAAGLPVVATAVGGLVDLIDDGRTGLLVPPDNPPALRAALQRLIDDPQAAAALGANARAEVTQRYSFERMVDGFESLYRAGLASPDRVAAKRVQAAGI